MKAGKEDRKIGHGGGRASRIPGEESHRYSKTERAEETRLKRVGRRAMT